jgi:SAM-dependent methyltransferase
MAEFDSYAQEYEKLLHDPIRERFAPGSGFFFERKWTLLQGYAARTGMDLKATAWLDVGCGKGDLLRIGNPQVARAAGCDLSAEMIAACKGLDVTLQTEPTRLPYADGEFDLVTAVCVYHHVPLDARAMLTTEIRRILRPGGIACMIEHNPFNPITQLIVHRTPVDADAILLTAGSARRVFSGAGFQSFSTEYFLYFPETAYKYLSGVESILSWAPGGGQYAVFARKPKN